MKYLGFFCKLFVFIFFISLEHRMNLVTKKVVNGDMITIENRFPREVEKVMVK